MPSTTSAHPPPHGIPVGFALGFAIFGAPAAWFFQLIINYALASRACYPNSEPLAQPIIGFLWWVLIGVDCVAIIVAVLAGYLAVSHWRRRRNGESGRPLIVGERRNQFLANWAMATSALFLTTLIFSIVLLFILPICDV